MAVSIPYEYKKLLDKYHKITSEVGCLPQGYISKKNIKGKQYFYLQTRKGGKIISRYIKSQDLRGMEEKILLYKRYKDELQQIEKRMLELEQAAKLIDKKLSRQFMLWKVSAGMDGLNQEQKSRSISFANAISAIEGVPISKTTEQNINEWKVGNKTFLSIFNETLMMYGFPMEDNHA